jgi:hypothetical protein
MASGNSPQAAARRPPGGIVASAFDFHDMRQEYRRHTSGEP